MGGGGARRWSGGEVGAELIEQGEGGGHSEDGAMGVGTGGGHPHRPAGGTPPHVPPSLLSPGRPKTRGRKNSKFLVDPPALFLRSGGENIDHQMQPGAPRGHPEEV